MKIIANIKMLTVAMVLMLAASVSSFALSARPDNVPVYWNDTGDLVPEAYSTLVRNAGGISMTLHTSGLRPGVYTAWWVTENYPQFCTERPCSLDDEANPLVHSSVFNATGAIVGADGLGNFGAWTGVGSSSSDFLFGPGLLNPFGADVYIVIRYHGPVIPGQVKQQLTTYVGGCSINECSDDQISFHISNS